MSVLPVPQQSPTLVDRILEVIRSTESGGNYQAVNQNEAPSVAASGAYQFIGSTWRSVAARSGVPNATQYQRAVDAPPDVQDAVARWYVQSILDANGGNPDAVWSTWYVGGYNPGNLDYVPSPGAGNHTTVRQYIQIQSNKLNNLDPNFQPTATGTGASNAGQPVSSAATGPGNFQINLGAGGGQVTSSGSQGSNAANTGEVPVYGWMQALHNIPEVGQLLDQATLENWSADKLEAEITNTNWWRTTEPTIRQWSALQASDPAGAQQQVTNLSGAVKRMGGALGITLSDAQSATIAENALKMGWSPDSQELKNAIIGEANFAPGTTPEGTIGLSQQQVKQLAASYLTPISDQQAQDFSLRLARGEISTDGLTVHFQQAAKGRFSWMADEIDAGFTPSDLLDSQKQAIAKTLEIDPETIDLANDSKWWPVVDVADTNGKHRSMTISEAARWARNQNDYQYTDQAREAAFGLSDYLSQSFGMRK